MKGCRGNNLKNIDLKIPLNTLSVVTGVSGSGKSTLINETLYPIIHNKIYNAEKNTHVYKQIKGLEEIDKIVNINQSPIGRTPRSNPATYCGVFSEIRNISLSESVIRVINPVDLALMFQVEDVRNIKEVVWNKLKWIFTRCMLNVNPMGKRFNRETLEIKYKGKSINDVLIWV